VRSRLTLTLLPLMLLAGVIAACAPGSPPTTTTLAPKYVMDIGHIDAFEVTVVGNALKVQIKDSTFISSPSIVYRDPAGTILRAKAGAGPTGSQTAVPNPAGQFAFLGAPGSPIWLLPQVQNPNLLWPGLSTGRINSGVLQGNSLSWVVDSVSGPGSFHLYQTSAFGSPQVKFTSNSPWPQSSVEPVGAHAHFTWAFGALGTYTLNFRATATLANGTAVTSGPVPYTVVVGNQPA
jgi:surface-anchored protein